ncbi:MAG: DMT family transporter [Burkholderiales bacterium]
MPPAPASPVWRAAFWMGGAMCCFLAMAISGRELARELTTFQVLFFRSLVGLAVIAVFLYRAGWPHVRTQILGTQVLRTHFVRNFVHFTGQYGWFYGVALIPLTEVFALEFTMPIWTAVLAPFLLGERMTRMRVLVVLIGFAGTLVILRPGIAIVHPAALAVLAGAFSFALAHTLTKRLSRSEAPLSILFYMTLIQLPIGFVFSLHHWVWPSLSAWPWVIVVGNAALFAHYCMTRAFQLADATVVIPMDFLRLPLIATVGFGFYGEKVDAWVLAGAVILCAGAWLNIKTAAR